MGDVKAVVNISVDLVAGEAKEDKASDIVVKIETGRLPCAIDRVDEASVENARAKSF